MKEKWNEQWKVWKEDNAFRLIFAVPDDARTVDLPYDAVFHQAQNQDSVNQGRTGFLNGGVFNYYKSYTPAMEDQGKHISLYFEGIMGRASIFVNGSLVCENSYAYMPFEAEIGKWLKYGQQNDILVMVNAMNENSRYYCGGGICRDVWLIQEGAVRFRRGSSCCTTLSVSDSTAVVWVESTLINEKPCLQEGILQIRISHGEKTILENDLPVTLPAGREYHQSLQMTLENIQPWSELSPRLYDIFLVWQSRDGGTRCEDHVRTGFRTVAVDPDRGLLVNGQPVKLRGACIHHDQGLLGAETHDGYEYRRVRILKEAGFNAVRCAHNPASFALLRACDELGMFIMDEAFDMWSRMKNPQDYALFFTQDASKVLRAMVENDRNHPSVIFYSTGNEITEIGTEKGYEISHDLTELLHQLDPTRSVTNGINGVFAAGNRLIRAFSDITGEDAPEAMRGDINECMSVLGSHMTEVVRHGEITDILDHLEGTMDVLGYNYMTGRYEMDLKKHPQRVIVGTETYPRQIAENWALIQKYPALLGDFTWTGWDYLGETGGLENYPWLQNFSGDIDATGERKPVSFYREIAFGRRTDPYLAVRSPEQARSPRPMNPWQLTDARRVWRFDGQEGRTAEVEVYSAGDTVELFLNGISQGRKSSHGLYPCFQTWEIPYEPGELRVKSWQGEKLLGCDRLETTEDAARLYEEHETYAREDGALVFLILEGRDGKNRRTRETISNLTLEMDDHAAELLAFGSRGSVHQAGYTRSCMDALQGRAMVVIRKRTDALIPVRVTGQNVEGKQIMI